MNFYFQAVHIQGQEPLTATMLATAQPTDQKQMLGERLFPLIQVKTADIHKITLKLYGFDMKMQSTLKSCGS